MSSQWIHVCLKIIRIFVLLGMVMLLLGGGRWLSARAEPGATYNLFWWTVSGGGASATSGSYSLGGTIGQADASQLTGGIYHLNSGFWYGISLAGCLNNLCQLYIPIISVVH